jgi:hypothetical protein
VLIGGCRLRSVFKTSRVSVNADQLRIVKVRNCVSPTREITKYLKRFAMRKNFSYVMDLFAAKPLVTGGLLFCGDSSVIKIEETVRWKSFKLSKNLSVPVKRANSRRGYRVRLREWP